MECEEDTVEIEEMIENINQMMQKLEERKMDFKAWFIVLMLFQWDPLITNEILEHIKN